jgi:hypothetical protein
VSLLAVFVLHELRTQARSLRFRVLATAYVLAGSAPAVLAWWLRRDGGRPPGAATCVGEVMGLLPLLTAVLAVLLSLDAVFRERDEGSWSTASLAGVSSSGYLLRRWLALQAVLLPLSLLPHLAAASAALAGAGDSGISLEPVLFPWLVVTAPVVLAFSALGLGLGTIAGSAGNALLLGAAVLVLLPMLGAAALGRIGVGLTPPLDGLNLPGIRSLFYRLELALNPKSPWREAFPLDVSDSPYDAGVAAEQYLSRAALALALAAACLGTAVFFLRRSRPDMRPWRIPADHPLRTFLAALSRLRERARPDPRPALSDLLVFAVALLAATGAIVFTVGRARSYDGLARVRFAAEREGGPSPTPVDLLPGRWRLEGRIGPGREVDLTVTAEMRNLGPVPRGHLAFELNPYLHLLAVSSPAGRVTAAKRWDRLALELAPPIPPGGRRELRFRLAGEPGDVSFSLPRSETGFQGAFGHQLHARFARDLADLSRSYRLPALSGRRIDLAAADLVPLPRYESWQLGPEHAVPEATFHPQADLEIALTFDRGVFLADSCGGVSGQSGQSGRGNGDGRLASRCRQPLADLAIAGGRYRRLASPEGGVTVAVFPLHAKLGERHLGFLSRGSQRLAEAWPGLGDLRRLVVLEWPDEGALDVDATQRALYYYDRGEQPAVRVTGNLVRLKERDLLRSRPLDPDSLVAEVVASRLGRRRPIAAADSLFFAQFLRDLTLERLGKGPERGATVGPLRPGQAGAVHVPPPKDLNDQLYWRERFPALVAALEARMGAEALRQAVDELFAREDVHPATAAELYTLLRARSEAPLEGMIRDFFVDGALPSVVLEGVAFRHAGNTGNAGHAGNTGNAGNAGEGWRVTGRMRNEGDGEALCKVVLTTDLGPLETTARAGEGEAAAFAFVTRNRPQSVRLDPDRECHRLIPNGAPRDQVYFDGRGG